MCVCAYICMNVYFQVKYTSLCMCVNICFKVIYR